MPKPLKEEHVLPMAITQAAAEAYMGGESAADLSFADFFMQHNLSTAADYSDFYSPLTLVKENAHALPAASLTTHDLDYYCIDHHLDHLLVGAAQDTAQVYRAVGQFLYREEGDYSRLLPILQNSRSLARRIGSVDSGIGGLCLLNAVNNSVPFAVRRGEDNVIQQIDLGEEARQQYIKPNISKGAGCPLLTRIVHRTTVDPRGGHRIIPIKLYDLYWDGFLQYVHTCMVNGRRVIPNRTASVKLL